MNNFKNYARYLFSMLFLSCAFDRVHVKQLPAQLDTTQQQKNSFVLEKEEKRDFQNLPANRKSDYPS